MIEEKVFIDTSELDLREIEDILKNEGIAFEEDENEIDILLVENLDLVNLDEVLNEYNIDHEVLPFQ